MVRNPPRFLTWPGHGGGDNPVETAGQRFGSAFAVPDQVEFDGELTVEDLPAERAGDGGPRQGVQNRTSLGRAVPRPRLASGSDIGV